MSNPIDRGDFGIVFYGTTTSPPPTYTDVDGQLRTAIVLTTSMQLMPISYNSAYFHAGGVARFTFQIDIDIDEENSTFEIGLLGHFDTNPSEPFGELTTFRNDDQQNLSIHTFEEAGRFILQTGNLGSIVEGAIQAALGEEDHQGSVIVRMRVER